MFEGREEALLGRRAAPARATANGIVIPPARTLDADAVRDWIEMLAGDGFDGLEDPARIDLIRALEDLKSAAAAAQARVSVDFAASQRAEQKARGVPTEQLGRGVGAQVALARRESPHAGGRFLGLAQALVAEMPHTLAALSSGVLSEWRATVLVRESACLAREDREEFDRRVAADARALVGLGTRALTAKARAVAQRLDVAAMVARARRAENERCVTLRPAPDTMCYLTALLPVRQGVAAYAALTRAADAARAAGDMRSRGQAMADEFTARIASNPATSETGAPTRLEVQLVMTDRTLLAGDDEPAMIPGYGTVPGPWARNLVLDALSPAALGQQPGAPLGVQPGPQSSGQPGGRSGAHAGGGNWNPLGKTQVWLRRLFTAPTTGQLVAMDSRSRLAPSGLADLIRARDAGACRTPYCDAPIRHIDHVCGSVDDGPTSAANLQGLCEGCNYAKQAPGWRESVAPPGAPARTPDRFASDSDPGGAGEADDIATDVALGVAPDIAPDVLVTTPTGHQYVSRAPALPGSGPPKGSGESARPTESREANPARPREPSVDSREAA